MVSASMGSGLSVAIEAIWENSREGIEGRIATLEEAVAAMLACDLGDELRARAERDAHKLAGSLGMFGFLTGSELAREVEQALGTIGVPAPSDVSRLAELVLALRAEFNTRPANRPADDADAPEPEGVTVLFVGSDTALTERLSTEALGRNLKPRRAATPVDARRLAAVEPPDAVVLDMAATDDLRLLENLSSREPPVPVIVLTDSETLVDRVEVARRGGRGFLARTRPAPQVIDIVNKAITRRDRSDTKTLPGSGAAVSATRTILVIDDSALIRRVVQMALGEARGWQVRGTESGVEGIDLAARERPDAILLDVEMPDVDGPATLARLQAQDATRQIPVLFLTGRSAELDRRELESLGAAGVIAKPFDPATLAAEVARLLRWAP